MTILMIEFSLAVWKHPNMAMHAPVSLLLSDRARYVSAYTGHYNYLLSSWALLSRYCTYARTLSGKPNASAAAVQ